ncbi:MAG: hypothetical protein ACE5JX_14160 [Acidobacteriota bacterium]
MQTNELCAPLDVALSGDYAYVIDELDGLTILDISSILAAAAPQGPSTR